MKKLVILILLVLSIVSLSDGRIFVFHRFEDFRLASTHISEKRTRELFDYLNDNNYEVIPMKELLRKVREKEEISDKIVVLTIDDGYKSFYDNGLKLFIEYNFPFTLYVPTKAVNKGYNDYMSWEEIKEVSKYGEIGAHSYSHPHMPTLSEDEIINEVRDSVSDIEENIGIRTDYYSYPYGEFTERVANIVNQMAFTAIFNQNNGGVSTETDLYNIDRIAITDDSNFKLKFRYKFLKAKWFNVEGFANISRLDTIKIEVPKDVTMGEFYISGYGWERVNVEDGIAIVNVNKDLRFYRNRAIFKTYDNRYTTQVVICDKFKPID